jgi:toxin-antitoxin system PIN domain toxin
VDSNVLVKAHREEATKHDAAVQALRELTEGPAAWSIPVFVLGEFLRVVTHPRVFAPPSSIEQALAFVDSLLDSPSARLLAPGPRYRATFTQVVADAGATGNLVFDAQIAAVCLEQGATTILSDDRDFRRFSGLTVQGIG